MVVLKRLLTKLSVIDRSTMIGTKVYLGSFTVNSSGLVISVTPAVPVLYTRTIEEPVFTGNFVKLPDGPSNQRPSSPLGGYVRFNTDSNEYEGYKLGRWDTLGGGQMFGNALVKAVSYNAQVIAENITVTAGLNAYSVGDITINNGVTVTVDNTSVYKVL